ncbi:hypothetical protein [Streptomyces sp. NPDC001450]
MLTIDETAPVVGRLSHTERIAWDGPSNGITGVTGIHVWTPEQTDDRVTVPNRTTDTASAISDH